jgi:hypothetical protein
MRHQACFFVAVHGACQACSGAGRVFAVSALYGEADWLVHFQSYAADWTGFFSVVGFGDVF